MIKALTRGGYARQLIELRLEGRASRLAAFAGVGACGVGVNSGALATFAEAFHLRYVIASVCATQIAILSNYAMSESFVFRAVEAQRPIASRFITFVVVNNVSLLLSGPLLVLLVSFLGVTLLVANVLSLALVFVVRFLVADAYVWGSRTLLPNRLRIAPAMVAGSHLDRADA